MEREVVQLMEGAQAWPLHMMGMATTATSSAACCFDDYSSSSSSGSGSDCFALGWDWERPAPPFGCFGLLAAADVHDLFPLSTESPLPVSSSSPSSAPLPVAPPEAHDAAVPGELDDLLLNFWGATCRDGDVGEPLGAQQHGAFNSSCVTHEQACTVTSDAFLHYRKLTTRGFFVCQPAGTGQRQSFSFSGTGTASLRLRRDRTGL